MDLLSGANPRPTAAGGPEDAATPGMTWKRIARAGRRIGLGLVALELLYLLLANGLIASGLIERAALASPDVVALGWERAVSPWPGRVYLTGFRLGIEDPVLQFQLTIDSAEVDVVLGDLLHKKFHASRVVARGVGYRSILKVREVAGNEGRLAAFPPLEGFTRPPVLADPMPQPKTEAEVAALWQVQLDDVDASLSELWFLEYRYRGHGRVLGAFGLAPLRRLWVGPALLVLDGGRLEAGEHLVASPFALRAEVALAAVDVAASPGLLVLRTLTASLHVDTPLVDLGAAELYVGGLKARGAGRLAAKLELVAGHLMAGSSLEVWLPATDLQRKGYRFTGAAHARLTVPGTLAPAADATLHGVLSVPLHGGPVVAALSGLAAELVLADNDLSTVPSIARLSAALREVRVRDVRTVSQAVATIVPLIAPAVLGDGPLVGSATASVTPGYALVRLEHLHLGDAAFEGAAVAGANGWSGAAAGHFGTLPLGLRLRDSKLESVLFPPRVWLGEELLKSGIAPRAGAPQGRTGG